MSKQWRDNDPNAQEEAGKYDRPVPSRDYIIEFLRKWGAPISHAHLCAELKLSHPDDIEAVRRRLIAMCRDGQLISDRRNQFGLIEKMDLIPGRVIGHRDGFGFVKPDAGGDDLFISARQMKQLFDGDRVLVQEIGSDHRGRPEGKVIELLERPLKKVVGRFDGENGFGSLIPENQRITNQIVVMPDPDKDLKYEDGQLIVVELVQQPDKRHPARAKVVEVLGDHLAPGMEIQVAIHNHDIPNEWNAGVHQEIGDLTPEVREEDKTNRVDLRDLPFVTIDGEDARDFDDAVYAEKKRMGGWRLWVAIADVSYYVKPNSELDKEAVKRGNSVYFPEYVVPMLPELLSNGLCSLNPNVDRLAMVCKLNIKRDGSIGDAEFFEGIINSKARLTYTKVGAMLDRDDDSADAELWRDQYKQVLPHLQTLHGLFHRLREARDDRGAIDFDTTETRIVFSDERKIQNIVPVTRNDAHKLIEECMLAANVATAKFLAKRKKPAIYRIHDGPKEQRLENLRAFLGELGLALPGGDSPEPKDYLKLASAIENRPDRHIIQTMMLRSMQQAVYSPDNHGHFGLAYEEYTHFTSPIRRYPDLLVHRMIRSAIHEDKKIKGVARPDGFVRNPSFVMNYSAEQMLQFGEHCSMTERRADEATRDVISWLKCEYMQSQIGEEFTGVVSAVTGFGVFVELDDLFVDGLVHITSLPSDYYQFEAGKQRLIGERTRRVFKLGDRLGVRVAQVNLDERKIDFELLDSEKNRPTKKPSVRERLAMGLFDQKGKGGAKSGARGKGSGSGRSSGGRSGGGSGEKFGGKTASKSRGAKKSGASKRKRS